MRETVVKLTNVILIIAIIFIYQSKAVESSNIVAEYESQSKATEEEIKEYEKSLVADDKSQEKIYQDGDFQGTGTGYGGDIEVSVSIKDDQICDIQILSADKETTDYLNMATAILEDIMDAGGTDVDVISGATFSSNGILDAVDEALAKAKAK